jgi:oxygen-dependent protoporphyrinogen oxidase
VLGVKGAPTYQHVFVHRRAIPQYDVGFGRFKTFMNKLEKDTSGLFFAGPCRDGVSLVDSIVSRHEDASRIANHLSRTT